jgi:hypothetical protein
MTRVVTFTIAHDEPLFEPLWREYYAKAGDIVIYDPRTTPGLPLELGSRDAESRQVDFVFNATTHLLASGYDVVMCPDIDEFLIPSNGQTLREFCETFEGDCAQAQGYQVVHQRKTETAADFRDPLKDRAVSFVSEAYTKTILTRTPLSYGVGRHYAYPPGLEHDFESRIKHIHPDLDLVHLKFVDFEYDLERWTERALRCTGMAKFTREQFEHMYDQGHDPVGLWIYWEGQSLAPKAHWRDALRMPDLFAELNCRADIPELLLRLNAKRICEVGVREGEHLRELLVPSVREAHAVDMWRETGKRSENDACLSQDELDSQCESVGNIDRRISVNRAPSILAAMSYPVDRFDFVYIDADHTEDAVAADLRVWWPRVRRGGVLAGHDYYDVSAVCADGTELTFGVVAAVNRFVAENNLQLHVDADGDWFVLK